MEIAIIFVQPYPFLNKVKYREYNNNVDEQFINAEYEINDVLLCFMILLRSYFITRSLLKMTSFTEPRAQRVCNMYGTEASYGFAMKALMKNSPLSFITIQMTMCMMIFGYTVRLFER